MAVARASLSHAPYCVLGDKYALLIRVWMIFVLLCNSLPKPVQVRFPDSGSLKWSKLYPFFHT